MPGCMRLYCGTCDGTIGAILVAGDWSEGHCKYGYIAAIP